MKTNRYPEAQILAILREAEGGVPVAELFPDPDGDPARSEAIPVLTAEARAVLSAFERIRAAPVRRAVARIVAALAA